MDVGGGSIGGHFGLELLLIQHGREFIERKPAGIGREVPVEQIFQSVIFECVEGEIHKARYRRLIKLATTAAP